MKQKTITAKVYTNQSNGQKLVTVPKDSDLKDGDYVSIKLAFRGEIE